MSEEKDVAALTLDGRPIALRPHDIEAFQGSLRGSLVRAGDPTYEDSRKLWNGMIDRKPALVVRPTGTADVVECVNFARGRGLLISIKGGGHNIAGTAVAEGGLTLDMSRMKGVFVNPKDRTARVQPGCILGDVDRETQLHGLATPFGFVSETGVAGLTLGGGFGYLTRRFGWSVDNLLEVEIVTADGRVLRASSEEHPELYWALRGGGGNFGVVTSFTYRLHPVGPKIVEGLIAWPADRAAKILELYRRTAASAPRELTLVLVLRFAPPAPFIPPDWRGKPIVGIVACHTGSLEHAHRDLAPLKQFGGAIVDVIMEKTYVQQQSMLDANQPKGNHYYWKSEYLATLPDAVCRSSENTEPARPVRYVKWSCSTSPERSARRVCKTVRWGIGMPPSPWSSPEDGLRMAARASGMSPGSAARGKACARSPPADITSTSRPRTRARSESVPRTGRTSPAWPKSRRSTTPRT